MDLLFVIPDMEKTFGKLEFGSAIEPTQDDKKRVRGGLIIAQRRYTLYSDAQRADNIEVILPGEKIINQFRYMEAVKLVNPRITVKGYAVEGRGFTDYILSADDIVKA